MRTMQCVATAAALVLGHGLASAADAVSVQASMSQMAYSLSSLNGGVSTPTVTFTQGTIDTSSNIFQAGSGSNSVAGGYVLNTGGFDFPVAESVPLAAAGPFPGGSGNFVSSDGLGQASTGPNQVSASLTIDSAAIGNLYTAAAGTSAFQPVAFAGVTPAFFMLPDQANNVWEVTLSAHSSITLSAQFDYSITLDEATLRSALSSFGGKQDTFQLSTRAYSLIDVLDSETLSTQDLEVVDSLDLGGASSLGPVSQALSMEVRNDSDAAHTYYLSYAATASMLMSVEKDPTSVVPEPGTWALMGLGLGFLGWCARRRHGNPV